MRLAIVMLMILFGISGLPHRAISAAQTTDLKTMDIEKTYELPFPPQQVYAAWVSSDTVIAPATSMDINPVVGGHYRLIMENPEFTGKNEGEFLIVEPNRHVRYTWEWNNDGEITEIDVVFSESPTGTRIVLQHTGFKHAESAEMHASGWDSYINGLTEFLEKR